MSNWSKILTREQVGAHLMRHAELNPARMASNLKWWLERSAPQLRALQSGAWAANDSETYMLARSLLAHPATRAAA